MAWSTRRILVRLRRLLRNLSCQCQKPGQDKEWRKKSNLKKHVFEIVAHDRCKASSKSTPKHTTNLQVSFQGCPKRMQSAVATQWRNPVSRCGHHTKKQYINKCTLENETKHVLRCRLLCSCPMTHVTCHHDKHVTCLILQGMHGQCICMQIKFVIASGVICFHHGCLCNTWKCVQDTLPRVENPTVDSH